MVKAEHSSVLKTMQGRSSTDQLHGTLYLSQELGTGILKIHVFCCLMFVMCLEAINYTFLKFEKRIQKC